MGVASIWLAVTGCLPLSESAADPTEAHAEHQADTDGDADGLQGLALHAVGGFVSEVPKFLDAPLDRLDRPPGGMNPVLDGIRRKRLEQFRLVRGVRDMTNRIDPSVAGRRSALHFGGINGCWNH